jgi:hypothetical protein
MKHDEALPILSKHEFGGGDYQPPREETPAQRHMRRRVECDFRSEPGAGIFAPPHVWKSELEAPPVDYDLLNRYASDVRQFDHLLKLDRDCCITPESERALAEVIWQVSPEDSRTLDILVHNYKSWALAWYELTADHLMNSDRDTL